MAKQAGPLVITGCFQNICFYQLSGNYYARMKSSLNAQRVKNDPAFKNTMLHAGLLGSASRIASVIYRMLPRRERKHSMYRKLTGATMQLLKQGKTDAEIFDSLCGKPI